MNNKGSQLQKGGNPVAQVRICLALFIMAAAVTWATATLAQTPPPAIFFTDLTSAPNTGGETVSGYSGAYVTIYGNNFGSSQGSSTITWNGLNCLRVVSWGTTYLWYQKIVVQTGTSCTAGTGDFTVTVGGVASTGARENDASGNPTVDPGQFTSRTTGTIRCVSTSGNDSSAGTFSAGCWKTMAKATSGGGMSAGDVTYVENGVSQTSNPTGLYGSLSPTVSGSNWTSTPYAIVAYPGATATIGTNSNDGIFICSTDEAGACGQSNLQYWTFAGFTIRGANSAFGIAHNVNYIRIVANDMSCPNGAGETACVTANAVPPAHAGFYYFYGNNMHDAGATNSTKTYHSIYWSSNEFDIWNGWNQVSGGGACRGIQFYSTGGSSQYDLHVHDNYLFNIRCDGINFDTVQASSGRVEAYNNVENNVGAGPDPSDGQADYSCILIGNSGSTPVLIYNNTGYACGTRNLSGSSGAINFAPGSSAAQFNNNVFYLTASSSAYFTDYSCSQVTGSNNDWFGRGAPNCALTADKNVDPQFISASGTIFSLTSGSPMIGAGRSSQANVFDFAGLLRPSPPSMGAYEYSSATSALRPAPPTNLIVTVN